MRKQELFVLVFGIVFLFLIQMAGTLVESIYILDLMHTSLDEKALGVLFFFAPVLLLAFRSKTSSRSLAWVLAVLLVLARCAAPYLTTSLRLLAAGLATGSGLMLLGLLLASAKPKAGSQARAGLSISAGLALALVFSIFLRTANSGIDLSLSAPNEYQGFVFGALLLWSLSRVDWRVGLERPRQKNGLALPLLGIFLIFILAYFAFSAPAVIARWTGASYTLIVSLISLLSAAWAWLALCRPQPFEALARARSPRALLVIWNLAFAAALVWTIAAQGVAFPKTAEEAMIVSGVPGWWQILPLVLMLLLFPVLFADLRVFSDRIRQQTPSPADLAPGLLLGSFVLVLLVFMNIFSNVWGYIEPVSTPFRGLYWLPFLLSAGGLALLVGVQNRETFDLRAGEGSYSWSWTVVLVILFVGSAASALRSEYTLSADGPQRDPAPATLTVMTYNIQAGNDGDAEPSFDRQLALIRQVSPDILALQESDTARISLNNNDFVRYYADKLGYYAYYGPTTVTGTFGTAILSRYPLRNPAVTFTYSDSDEVGTSEAEIEVGGKLITIYNVHPDGSETAKVAFANALLARSEGKAYVIALGDYNSRKTDTTYQLVEGRLTNAWTSVYPSEISPDGIDMSGRNRIDHIFFSSGFSAANPVYILPPDSATDHPVHWSELIIK